MASIQCQLTERDAYSEVFCYGMAVVMVVIVVAVRIRGIGSLRPEASRPRSSSDRGGLLSERLHLVSGNAIAINWRLGDWRCSWEELGKSFSEGDVAHSTLLPDSSGATSLRALAAFVPWLASIGKLDQ